LPDHACFKPSDLLSSLLTDSENLLANFPLTLKTMMDLISYAIEEQKKRSKEAHTTPQRDHHNTNCCKPSTFSNAALSLTDLSLIATDAPELAWESSSNFSVHTIQSLLVGER